MSANDYNGSGKVAAIRNGSVSGKRNMSGDTTRQTVVWSSISTTETRLGQKSVP